MVPEADASILVGQLASACKDGRPIGCMSASIYDTAWVSMVSKVTDGRRQWLFPDSFQYVLDKQLPDGGWESYASDLDGILNTMAALLAILHNRKQMTLDGSLHIPEHFESRIFRATQCLNGRLKAWDVASSDHVGFELLVPTLLRLLSEHGVDIGFPGLDHLMDLNAKKLTNFDPVMLYSDVPTSAIHSLEAFVGKVDFQKLAHHKRSGSMMGSPAATAAYLVFSGTFDDDMEAYLQGVSCQWQAPDTGAFPSAFPSTIFELTWVMSTLLEGGFSVSSLGSENVDTICDCIEGALRSGGGLVGFAPHMMADADDTSKALLALRLLGRPSAAPQQLISTFDSERCFKTYSAERNPSFSSNCNVLNALLHQEEPNNYTFHISKAISFLIDCWMDGPVKDKWNRSSQYPMMLLAQAFSRILILWDEQMLDGLSLDLLNQIPIVLLQIITRTLSSEESNGSWSQTPEVTAYAILTLVSASAAPWTDSIRADVSAAVTRAKDFLTRSHNHWRLPAYIWIEKVTYASPVLSNAYCLAALQSQTLSRAWSQRFKMATDIQPLAITEFSKFFSKISMFSHWHNSWKLRSLLIESRLFLPRLRAMRLNIFPREEMAKDRYLEYIPFTWLGCNALSKPVHPTILWEMMLISMLNYQADEYMEAVVGVHFEHNLQPIRNLIDSLCLPSSISAAANGTPNGRQPDSVDAERNKADGQGTKPQAQSKVAFSDIECVLYRFTVYVLRHPKVLQSPASAQSHLRRELRTFLLAHITQIEDNTRLSQQEPGASRTTIFTSPQTSYFAWVRSTSADHTSCPYAFAFFACLIAPEPGKACFSSLRQRYLAEDACRHLATLCRQYNDYGSVARDRAEKNLNSVNFPEFDADTAMDRGEETHVVDADEDGEIAGEKARKQQLMWLAQYERECLEVALGRLRGEVSEEVMNAVDLFVRVTDLYGQIYVARDIASRMK